MGRWGERVRAPAARERAIHHSSRGEWRAFTGLALTGLPGLLCSQEARTYLWGLPVPLTSLPQFSWVCSLLEPLRLGVGWGGTKNTAPGKSLL